MKSHDEKTAPDHQAKQCAVLTDGADTLFRCFRIPSPGAKEHSVPGLALKGEGYFGREGHLSALLTMAKALSGRAPQEVYLTLRDASAISGSLWERAAGALFPNHHRWHITLPRLPESFLRWQHGMPENVTLYELPEDAECHALLLDAPGLGAVVSGVDTEQTLLLWDNGAFRCHDALFYRHIPLGEPVLQTLGETETLESELLRLVEAPGPFTFYKDTLGGYFVPPDALPQGDKKELRAQAERLSRHRDLFRCRAQNEGWTDILPRVLLDAISLNGSCHFPASLIMGKKDLVLRGPALRAALQTMLSCLEAYPRYRILWSDTPPEMWVAVNGQAGALFHTPAERPRTIRLTPLYECWGLKAWAAAQPYDEDRGRAALKAVLEDLEV